MNVPFSTLLGKTLTRISQTGIDEIVFEAITGERYRLYHEQDCCEDVTIEDIVGDLKDLIGSPILMAVEALSYENPDNIVIENQESFTWTYYKLATFKGRVDIRWYGSSNGCYSETVSFEEIHHG